MLIYWGGSPRGGAGGMAAWGADAEALGPGAAQPAARSRQAKEQERRRIITRLLHQRSTRLQVHIVAPSALCIACAAPGISPARRFAPRGRRLASRSRACKRGS